MSDSTPAVFLSYASQDAATAVRIAEALRASGIVVWFDQNELGGGDVWDAKIRGQIKSCALFVPVVSAATQARLKGYFRLEWKLAAQRTHTMADAKPFLLPVVIDTTRDAEAHVPEEFRAVQWTRLPGGEVPVAFVQRVRTLLEGPSVEPKIAARGGHGPSPSLPSRAAGGSSRGRLGWFLGASALVALALATWILRPGSSPTTAERPPSNSPDARSIAVLPFENLSPDKENEFFADGMHDEVITALSKIRELTVIARASVLDYRGAEKRNLRQIATELGVAHVMAGRVRRDGPQALHSVAIVHLVLGDHDRAVALLDQALSVPSALITNEILHIEPWWKPLHGDPRFKAALAKAAPRD